MCRDVVKHLLIEGVDRCQGRSILLSRLGNYLLGTTVGAGLQAFRELHLTGCTGVWPCDVRVLHGHSFVFSSAVLLNEIPYPHS